MKIFKKFAAVMLVAAMSLSFTACGNGAANGSNETSSQGTEVAEGDLVAQIGDIKITKDDLKMAMAQTDAQLQMYYGPDFKTNPEVAPFYNNLLDQAVEQRIGYEILVMKAKENKDYTVSAEDVEGQLSSIKSGYPSEEEFNKALEAAGFTLDVFKANLEKDLYYEQIINAYKEKSAASDEAVKAYYDENIANYTQGPGAVISHILVDSEELANEVLDKYNAGTSFEELAAQYGTDGTKTTGGSLGYIPYDTQNYDQDFMAGAKALGEGEVSKPVKTQFGWHLIKVDNIHKEDYVQPFEEVSEQIKNQLMEDKLNELVTADLDKWKQDYKILTYPANYQLQVQAADASADTDSADSSTEATTESTTEDAASAENSKADAN